MRKLFWVTTALAVAVFAWQYHLPYLALLMLLPALFHPVNRLLATGLVFLGLTLGFGWCYGYDQLVYQPIYDEVQQSHHYTATVADVPFDTSYGIGVQVTLHREGVRDVNATLYLDSRYSFLLPGDWMTFSAELKPSYSQEEDDYYSLALGVFWEGSPDEGTFATIRPSQVKWQYLPQLWCEDIKAAIAELFPQDCVPLVQGLLTGDKSLLSDSLYSDLGRAGLFHATAVSGLHISFLVWLMVLALGRNRWRTLVIGVPLLLWFCMAVGSSPSATRAVIMQVLLLCAPLVGRESDLPTNLSMALVLILLENPYAAYSVGLQLSFASVAGICFCSQRLYRWLWGKFGKDLPKKGLSKWGRLGLRFVYSSLAMTLGALAFTTPLSVYYYGYLSLIAPLSNLLCLWAVALIFPLGLVAVTLFPLCPMVSQLLADVLTPLVGYLLNMTAWLADVPFASLALTSPYLLIWFVCAYGMMLVTVFWPGRPRPVLSLCGGTVTLCLALVLTRADYQQSGLTMTVLDVGQGQSILLETQGRHILIDCGGSTTNTGDLVADYLQDRGIFHLDLVFLTHCHDDHAGGVPQLLERMRVDNLILPTQTEESTLQTEILLLAQAQELSVGWIDQHCAITLGETSLQIYPPLGAGDLNEEGLSLLVERGDFSALITGDMGSDIEARLVYFYDLPEVMILVAGHHGSAYASSQYLLDEINPEIALISVGENSYGHPADDTLARLTWAGCDIYRTDLQGTITLIVPE